MATELSGTSSPAVNTRATPFAGMPTLQGALVSVVITHHNYSDVVGDALASVVQQTHGNFECVVVDDGSDAPHRAALRKIVSTLNDRRVRLMELPANKGQTHAFFEGLRETSGEFVTMLDPDDLYEPLFLERMLNCHLNPCIHAPLAACEMGLFRIGGQILSRTYVGFKYDAILTGTLARAEASQMDYGFSTYHPSDKTGWLWGTTSSLMFRRDALEFLRRESYPECIKPSVDAYCAQAVHMLGGTLFLDEVLSWRGIHANNTAESPHVVGGEQNRTRPEFVDRADQVRFDAMDILLQNGAAQVIKPHNLVKTLRAQFTTDALRDLVARHPSLVSVFI